jgi:hypothetical protein
MRFLDVSLVNTVVHSGYVCIYWMNGPSDSSNRWKNRVCFTLDGKYLAATNSDKVRIYDVVTGARSW